MRHSLFAAALLAAALIAPVTAQNCTHHTVQGIGGSLVPFGVQPCQSGINITVQGFPLTLSLSHCPQFIEVTPARRIPLFVAGCGTNAVYEGAVPVKHLKIECNKWPFTRFWVTTLCEKGRESTIQSLSDHRADPCAKIPD